MYSNMIGTKENVSFNVCPICRMKIDKDERWCSKHSVMGEAGEEKTTKAINNIRKEKGLEPVPLKLKSEKFYINVDKVYFIKEHGGGNIKIGRTKGFVKTRLKSLQTGIPYKLEILYITCLYTEEELHGIFEKYNVRGEWYSNEVEDKIIKIIEKRKILKVT